MSNFSNFWVAEYNRDADQFNVTSLEDALTASCKNMIDGHPLWAIVYVADSTEKVSKAIESFRSPNKPHHPTRWSAVL
jgi:hypothetical protein